MTDLQAIHAEGALILAIALAAPCVLAIPCLCRYAVDAGGYRHLCLTRKGALRLALAARREGCRRVRVWGV